MGFAGCEKSKVAEVASSEGEVPVPVMVSVPDVSVTEDTSDSHVPDAGMPDLDPLSLVMVMYVAPPEPDVRPSVVQAELVEAAAKKAEKVDLKARKIRDVVAAKSKMRPREYRKWRSQKAKLILEWQEQRQEQEQSPR